MIPLPNFLPYKPTSESLTANPYSSTFANIPQGTKIVGLSLGFNFPMNYPSSSGNLTIHKSTTGNFKIPFSIFIGDIPVYSDVLLVLNPQPQIGQSVADDLLLGSLAGTTLDILPIESLQNYTVKFMPPYAITYEANSAQLIGVK